MGNAALRDLAALESVALSNIEPGAVAVDAHNWLYKYLTTTVRFTDESAYTTTDGEEVANLIGIVQGLPKFYEHGLEPVFVFDGGVTDLKEDEVERRREQRAQDEERLADAREAGDPIEIARLESRTQRLTPVIQETTRELFDLLDIPYLEAPAEGEGQAAYMARTDDAIEYVGSDDYDTLLFGAPTTLRQLTSSGDAERMEFSRTLDRHDISWEQLVDIALLCGTDFNEGLDGYGPKTALTAVRSHGDLWGVLEEEGTHIDHADRIRSLFLEPDVTADYDLSLSPRPDIDAARSFLIDDWEIPASELDRGFERLSAALSQTGLDRFT